MFGFSKKNKRGGIDHTKHNTTASMENIINSMTPPPQIVPVNQVMLPSSAPSPAAAPPPHHSGSTSSAGALVAAANADPPAQDLHNSLVKFNGVPVIDFCCPDQELFTRQVREACRDGGCFQAINYGVRKESVEKTSAGDTQEAIKLEYLPVSYDKEFGSRRSRAVGVISEMVKVAWESLRLSLENSPWKVQGDDQGQYVAMNYYPPWSTEPGLTDGVLHGHTDPNAFSIHILDRESPAGMQIFRPGRWVDVEPHPSALLFTIGDKIEALSQGKYKSAQYRMCWKL